MTDTEQNSSQLSKNRQLLRKEAEVDYHIQQSKEKLQQQLTNEELSEDQFKKQFYFMAKNHDKYPFMSHEDHEHFKEYLQNSLIYNSSIFSITGGISALIYKYTGGFTSSVDSPNLRRIRHITAITIPALLSPILVSKYFPSNSQKEIMNLSRKYRHKIQDPQFTQKIIDDQAEKYRQRKLHKKPE